MIRTTTLFFTAALALAFALCPAAHAKDVTMDEAISFAMENADAVNISRQAAQAVRAQGRQSTSFVRPQVEAKASYLWVGTTSPDPPPGLEFLAPHDKDLGAQATASQVVFAGMRIWNSLKLEKNLNVQADFIESTSLRDIKTGVRAAFDAVLYYQVAQQIHDDRVKQKKAEFQDASDLFEAGMVTSLDVRQTRQNLIAVTNNANTGQVELEEAVINFNLAVGNPKGAELLNPKGSLKEAPDIEELMNRLDQAVEKDDFLDIHNYESQVEGTKLSHDIINGEYYPEIALLAHGQTDGYGFSHLEESWSAGAQLSWSIYDGGLIRSKKAEKKANMLQLQDTINQTKKDLMGQVSTIEVNLDSLKDRIALQETSMDLAEKNYEDARAQYRAGTITLTRLGEFNLYLAEARFQLLALYFMKRQQITNALALLEK